MDSVTHMDHTKSKKPREREIETSNGFDEKGEKLSVLLIFFSFDRFTHSLIH